MKNIKMLDELLGEMHKFALEHQVPISTTESIMTIDGILQVYRPMQCLEIGTAIGYGTIEIARRIQAR